MSTHLLSYKSTTSQVLDSKSSPVRDRCYTSGPGGSSLLFRPL